MSDPKTLEEARRVIKRMEHFNPQWEEKYRDWIEELGKHHSSLEAECSEDIYVSIQIISSEVDYWREARIKIDKKAETRFLPIYDNTFYGGRNDDAYEYLKQYLQTIKTALRAPKQKKFEVDTEKAKKDFWG